MPPPPLQDLRKKVQNDFNRYGHVLDHAEAAPGGKYRHWDTLRHLKPPSDLTVEEWCWPSSSPGPPQREFPLTDSAGKPFTYAMTDGALESLHYITQHASGEIAMPEVVTASESARRHYLVNSLIEEAIRSSQLEGASTSRVVAKEMIRSGRPPINRSERMILNNYRALSSCERKPGRFSHLTWFSTFTGS